VDARRLPLAVGAASGVVLASAALHAQDAVLPEAMPVAFGADELRLDARAQALDARGHVHVDEPPFHFESEALKLQRVRVGVNLEGEGKLAFCPCLGAPLAVRFSGATLAPPHDVILRNPVLEVFGVPLAWAPLIWLRSPGRVGLLPPDLAWRGADGFFAGGGVHLPWVNGEAARGVDLRAGGYVDGGVAVEAAARTTTTNTLVRWDRFHGDDGLTVDATGATAIAGGERPGSVAWGLDALRGARAVKATTDVNVAARPFDRGQVQAAWLTDGWTFASGVAAVALRGGDLADFGVSGPVVAARRADGLGPGTFDVTLEGGQVAGGNVGATSFARAESGVLAASRLGPMGVSLSLRGVGDLADDGARSGLDGASEARATAALPFVRDYRSGVASDPWIHTTEPRIEIAAIATHTSGVLVVPAARGAVLPDGVAWVTDAGWENAVGRWGSRASGEAEVVGGFVGDDRHAMPALRAVAAGSWPWTGLRADFARVFSPGVAGGALLARGRVGPAETLHLALHVAERDGVDPLIARALVSAPLEPASGFLSASGWTGGARVAIPIGSRVTTRGGADVDFDAQALVAAVGSLELHDPCGCVVVRATAAHRIGRGGVDAWVTVDLPIPGR
jgi:hypothetical protein